MTCKIDQTSPMHQLKDLVMHSRFSNVSKSITLTLTLSKFSLSAPQEMYIEISMENIYIDVGEYMY